MAAAVQTATSSNRRRKGSKALELRHMLSTVRKQLSMTRCCDGCMAAGVLTRASRHGEGCGAHLLWGGNLRVLAYVDERMRQHTTHRALLLLQRQAKQRKASESRASRCNWPEGALRNARTTSGVNRHGEAPVPRLASRPPPTASAPLGAILIHISSKSQGVRIGACCGRGRAVWLCWL